MIVCKIDTREVEEVFDLDVCNLKSYGRKDP